MIDSCLPQFSLPLKEGRSHPLSSAYKGRSQRKVVASLTVFVFAVVCTLLITSHFFSWDHSSIPDAELVRTSLGKDKDSLGPIQHPDVETAKPLSEDEDTQQSTPDISSKEDNKSSDAQPTFPDGFDAALDYLSSIIPNEIYLRELLRPLMGTGPEKLRELGLRTRAYKQFFDAWEELHLVTQHDDNIYVRDDLVSYIRAKFSKENFPEKLRKYESYRYFLAKLSALLFPWTSPYFADHMSLHASFYHGGRGIVFTTGDNHAPFLLTTIPSLRTLGCNLPIEIMYLGDSDLSESSRAALEDLSGVTTRDLSAMVNDEGWRLRGWASKPFSILFSSFREVIFIDADSLFFVNPEVLFDDEDYIRTGALFFKDRMIMPENKKQWLQKILPKPISKSVMQSRMWTGESGHMQESGVVVVDKWRHFVALLLVSRMNGPDRDGNKKKGIIGIYDMVYGLSALTSPVFVSLI